MTQAPADASVVVGRPGKQSRLEAKGVTKIYASESQRVIALDDVSLTIDAGEFVTILGPSGCGKSTLMSIMAGLESPTSGEVALGGIPFHSPLIDAGFVFQRDLLLEWRTCVANILLQFQIRGQDWKSRREHAAELLSLTGLTQFADRYPHELSGGMRQRVAICRALIHDPALLFMDEPFGALDAITREALNVELLRLTGDSGTSVVFVTHSIEEAVFLADRVVVMTSRPGRIIGEAAVELLRPRGAHTFQDPRFVGLTGDLRRLLASG